MKHPAASTLQQQRIRMIGAHRMLDLETIFNLKHGDVLHVQPGSGLYKASRDGACQRWRVTGKVQRWKRDPERFRVPLKHGLYTYDALLPGDESRVHLESECTGGA